VPGKQLSRRAGAFIFAEFSATAVGTVTGIVLARVFTKVEMGQYRQLLLVYNFLASFLLLGLPSSLTYFYPTTEGRRKATTVYVVIGALFLLGIMLGAGTFFGAPLIDGYFKDARDATDLEDLIRRFFLFYAFTLGGAYMKRFLVSTNRYGFASFWLPFDRLLNLLSFAVPAALGYPLITVVTVAVWVAGFKFAVGLFYTMWVVPPQQFIWDSSLASRVFFYSLPIGLSAAVGQISRQIDLLVIGRFMDPDFFATYSWGAQHLPFVPVVATSVMTVLIPELARLYKDGERLQFTFIWHESIRKIGIFVLGVFAFVEFFAAPLIVALYSEKYVESILYFRLYQVLLLFRVTMFGYVMQSLGKTRIIFYVTLVSVAIKPVTSVLLFFAFGPVGPPLATWLNATVAFVIYLVLLSKFLGLRLSRVWPWSYYGRILGAAVVAAFGASWVLRLLPRGRMTGILGGLWEQLSGRASIAALVQLCLGGAIFLPVYVLLLYLFRTIKSKDWQLLKDVTIGRFKRR